MGIGAATSKYNIVYHLLETILSLGSYQVKYMCEIYISQCNELYKFCFPSMG